MWTVRGGNEARRTKLTLDAGVLHARLQVAGEMIRNRQLTEKDEAEISFIIARYAD